MLSISTWDPEQQQQPQELNGSCHVYAVFCLELTPAQAMISLLLSPLGTILCSRHMQISKGCVQLQVGGFSSVPNVMRAAAFSLQRMILLGGKPQADLVYCPVITKFFLCSLIISQFYVNDSYKRE